MAVKKEKKKTGKVLKKSLKLAAKPKSNNMTGSKIVFTTLSLGALGILGYLGWQYIKSKKQRRASNLDDRMLQNSGGDGNISFPSDISLDPLPTAATPNMSTGINIPPLNTTSGGGTKIINSPDDFPLKKGSKGDNVKQLQLAIIGKYGKAILPKYGADGDFGTETVNALKKLKMPETISETYYNVLTQGMVNNTGNAANPSGLASKIYAAVVKKDFNTVVSLLKSIKSSNDYGAVSEAFKQYRIGGVRKTLVNGLLDTFKTTPQKEQLRLAFATMGLTYDGEKWSLSGIDGVPIFTTVPAKVWINASTAVGVPANMILGHEIARRLQYVLFVNNGRHFLVHSNCIKHLKSN